MRKFNRQKFSRVKSHTLVKSYTSNKYCDPRLLVFLLEGGSILYHLGCYLYICLRKLHHYQNIIHCSYIYCQYDTIKSMNVADNSHVIFRATYIQIFYCLFKRKKFFMVVPLFDAIHQDMT